MHAVRRVVLEYHDVIDGEDFDTSGFPGADAASYKLDLETFTAHLRAIHALGAAPPRGVLESIGALDGPVPVLTFDDGGRSASHPIADLLDEFGWIGHFFITTGRIGTAGFVGRSEIVDLHQRGHVIGTHSVSHPIRMSSCSDTELAREWVESTETLSNMLGTEVVTASLPGGYYDPRVAVAAAAAGLRVLFTSEPTMRPQVVDSCLVLGRFTLRRNSTATHAGALAQGRRGPRFRQWTAWNLKKIAKRVGGPAYLSLRKQLFR
jgi:peptidoglycan/xylan/chitin deacetylase (PgdA/CDA1 family)